MDVQIASWFVGFSAWGLGLRVFVGIFVSVPKKSRLFCEIALSNTMGMGQYW